MKDSSDRAGTIRRYASQLRFPQLFVITALLFIADLFVPDVIPFVDEILLGLLTTLLGMWRRRRRPETEPEEPMKSASPSTDG